MPGTVASTSAIQPAIFPPVSGKVVTDYLERVLRQLPTVFGRLVYVAALWDPESGSYRHNPLSQMISCVAVDRSIARIHAGIFNQWLALNVRQQRSDLMRYFDFDDDAFAYALRAWLDRGLLPQLQPAQTKHHERQLFLFDLTLLAQSQ